MSATISHESKSVVGIKQVGNKSDGKIGKIGKGKSLVRNWSKTAERKDVEVYVGRKSSAVPGTLLGADGRYGNPYVVGVHGTREEVIEKYRSMLYADTPFAKSLRKNIKNNLRGKVLACWCAPLQCHAGVIAELANSDDEFSKDGFETVLDGR